MATEPKKTLRATAKANGDFIDLRTLSGYRLAMLDCEGKHYHLPVNVSNEDLGRAVADVLSASRLLNPKLTASLSERVPACYEEWVSATIAEHQYRDRRAMFRKMRSCGIENDGDVIKFSPTKHKKLESWSGEGITPEDHVIVKVSSPADEIGAALRLALERCI